jgi:hypothetical protein
MIEFNPDGSIKLPERLQKKEEENKVKMQCQRCIKITRSIVNFDSPKKCVINIKLSDAMPNNRFIDGLYKYFQQKAQVPSKITKISEKEFEVEIGTDFRRCSDCCSLVNRYREFLDGNVIEDKGNCTYRGPAGFD